MSAASTHKVGAVTKTLVGTAPSASTVRRPTQTRTEPFDAWRVRQLQPPSRIVSLDGMHVTIQQGSQCDSRIIVTILGVDLEGNTEVLALHACADESTEGWLRLLHEMRSRGATHVDLCVTDGHEGLLAAVSEVCTATPRQRCLVHTQRTVRNAIPCRERDEVQGELVGRWMQEKKEEASAQRAAFQATYGQRYPEAVRSVMEDQEHLLTFSAFPSSMSRHSHTTNARARFFSNIRQRTDQIDAWTTETSCLSMVWAALQESRFHNVTVSSPTQAQKRSRSPAETR